VEDAIEALKSSLKVLESANNVNDQVDQSKYFAALKVWREQWIAIKMMLNDIN
jgi:flagellar biosynthesis regulator FlbT